MLPDRVTELANGPNFAAFTTLLPNGGPTTQVMWVGCDEEHVLLNTEVHRQKFRNVERDPRVVVTIIDHENPYRFAEIRGKVESVVKGPEARAHIDALAQKYMGRDYDDAMITSERVILKIRPDRVRTE